MRILKRHAANLLGRTPFALHAFKAYEALVALSPRAHGAPQIADGSPLPPARLRVLVSGTADPSRFIQSGRRDAALIAETVRHAGRPIERMGSILDFGCGCGRVVRHWTRLPMGEIYGSDHDARLVDWCRENLAFASFTTNSLAPPLSYGDEQFDLVYAFSVLTHLPAELGLAWVWELRRILHPGGFLLVTTQGDRYLDRLSERERDRFLGGGVVTRRPRGAGSNLCSVHHSRRYLAKVLARGFAVEHLRPGDDQMPQDVALLRKL